MPNDFALCQSRAGVQVVFPGADTRFVLCQQRLYPVVLEIPSTEELRIGKTLGRTTLAALELPLDSMSLLSAFFLRDGREDTCESTIDFRFPVCPSASRDSMQVL